MQELLYSLVKWVVHQSNVNVPMNEALRERLSSTEEIG